MVTATFDATSPQSLESAKAALRAQFEAVLAGVSGDVLLRAATRKGRQALTAIIDAPKPELSVETRNQQAATRMNLRSFERLQSQCTLLDANDVGDILGVSKQALSKKNLAGHVIAYSHNRRKFYPEFQFANSKVKPVIKQLVDALGLDPVDASRVNVLVKFLVQTINVAAPGEAECLQPRYRLLDQPGAIHSLVSDFNHRLAPGQ